MIVVDASLGVKWYLDEALADEAEDVLFDHLGDIAVPDLFVVEVSSALVRRANMDKTRRRESEAAIARLLELVETGVLNVLRSEADSVARATALAMDLGHPLKDCIYLVLAMDLGCPLITADTRFADRARTAYDGVRVLGD